MEIKLEVSGELRKAVERATSPLFKRAFESVHTVKLDMYIQDIDLLHITTNLTVTIRPQPSPNCTSPDSNSGLMVLEAWFISFRGVKI
ncbi:hypothetical protein Pcinc_013491 [Petrolisthes cinctipes]|uniref:Uncharacterized protein n=1 Tax=Petrolisthes cinctipes TaxID=88211 RepID=A0AAE1FWT2_PETCI|nr:hypothetical protein Pcinc_013491 [Petrolisthes cinctipes]